MPLALVPLSDGHEWMISPYEIIIPIRHARHMTATEIGALVLNLIPRIKRLELYANEWGPLDKIESLEAWVTRQEQKKFDQEALRLQITKLRREIQADYDHIFMILGRRDGFDCRLCGISTDLEIDHVVALINGGTNDTQNLQLLCKSCNCKKHDKN